MAKIHGKLASFLFGGTEICFQDANLNEDWEVRDATDSCTSGDGEETTLGRKTEVFEISGYLKDSGNKISCKNITCSVGGTAQGKIRSITLDESGVESDSTDGDTTGNGTETEIGFVNRKSTIQLLIQDTKAEPARNTNLTFVVTFASGHTVSGTLRVESFQLALNVKNTIGGTLTGTWQGGITKVGLGTLAVGDSNTVALILKDGTTDKAFTGSAILIGINLNGDYQDDLKVTFRFKVNGDLTATQYAA